jgi:hypothetical protein
MASIEVKLPAGKERLAASVASRITESLNKSAVLTGRFGVVGPLRHPATNRLTISVWVHDDVAEPFNQEVRCLLECDWVCKTVSSCAFGLKES